MKLCRNHFAVEMVSVSCISKPLDVLNGFQQVKKTKDLESLSSFSFGLTQLEEEERNGFCELYSKTILLWKWFLWVVLQNHFVVGMVSNKNNINNIFQIFLLLIYFFEYVIVHQIKLTTLIWFIPISDYNEFEAESEEHLP
jgi:hypothetical protein